MYVNQAAKQGLYWNGLILILELTTLKYNMLFLYFHLPYMDHRLVKMLTFYLEHKALASVSQHTMLKILILGRISQKH